MNQTQIDKTALSYWLPQIAGAGIPIPRTVLINMPMLAQRCVWAGFDGQEGTPEESESLSQFLAKLSDAVRQVGLPAFLRTDHTSNKHSWKRSCYLTSDNPRDISSHVFAIAEFSECCSMAGELPWECWAVREFLPTKPLGTCPSYGDMPVCREFRFFIADGIVKCSHPYWPREALEQGGAHPSVYEHLTARSSDTARELQDLAQRVADAVEGAWSVDILETERGWFVTDMAEAHKSFHWEGCEAAPVCDGDVG